MRRVSTIPLSVQPFLYAFCAGRAELQSCHVDRSAFRSLGATVGLACGVAAVPLAPRTVVVQLLPAHPPAVDPRLSRGDESHSVEPQSPRGAAAGRHAVSQRRVGAAADPPVDDERAGTAPGVLARHRRGPHRRACVPGDGGRRDAGAPRDPLSELVHVARHETLADDAIAAPRPAAREAERRADGRSRTRRRAARAASRTRRSSTTTSATAT